MDQIVKKNQDIEGVIRTPLKVIVDDRGAVMHMMRADSDCYDQFGEVYFSEVKPGVVKAWKKHSYMTQNIAVPVGKIKLVAYDDRLKSPTNSALAEFILGKPDNYSLLTIPPLIWYGFKGLGDSPSLIANCTNIPYVAGESIQMSINSSFIKYAW